MPSKEDIYKKIGVNLEAPAPQLSVDKYLVTESTPHTGPKLTFDIMGASNGYKPPQTPPTTEIIKPSEAIYQKIGLRSEKQPTPALDNPSGISDFLLSPSTKSNKTAQSTKAVAGPDDISTVDSLKWLFVNPNKVRQPFAKDSDAVEIGGGKVISTAANVASRLLEWIPHVVVQQVANINHLQGKDTELPFDASRLYFGKEGTKKVPSTGERSVDDELVKKYTDGGQTPAFLPGAVWGAFRTMGMDILDVLGAGDLLKQVSQAVLRNVAVPNEVQVQAWKGLGMPETIEQAKQMRNQLLIQFSNDTQNFTVGNIKAASEATQNVKNLYTVLEKQGIPKAPGFLADKARQISQVLNTDINKLGVFNPDTAQYPFAGTRGYLGGTAIDDTAQPVGLSIRKVKPVPGMTAAETKVHIASSEALNIEKTIASGGMPESAFYKPGTKILQPDFAVGRVQDIAEKLDQFKSGLGSVFEKSVTGNETMKQLVQKGFDVIDNFIPKSAGPVTPATAIMKGLEADSVMFVNKDKGIVENSANNEAVLTKLSLDTFGKPKFTTQNQAVYTPGQAITSPIEATLTENGKYVITDGANRFSQAVANGDKDIPVVLEIVKDGKALSGDALVSAYNTQVKPATLDLSAPVDANVSVEQAALPDVSGETKAPVVPASLEPLAQEARRYSSAEEFKGALYPSGGALDVSNRGTQRFGRLIDIESPNLSEFVQQYPFEAKQLFNGRIPNMTKPIEIYRAAPSGTSIEAGDWVALNRNYAESHAGALGRDSIITMKVDPADIRWAETDAQEWFYAPKAQVDELKGLDVEDFYNKATSDIAGVDKENSAFVNQQIDNYKPGDGLPTFIGFKDISTKVLERLVGRKTVSNQYISDLTKNSDIKQAEKDVVLKVLNTYGDQPTIPVQEFAHRVKLELLPIEIESTGTSADPESVLFERITLPEDVRGNVISYKENLYGSPIKNSTASVHFQGMIDNYFAHTRIEDMPDGIRRVIEMQSDLFQKGRLDREFSQFDATKSGIENEATLASREADLRRLEPYKNIWHERIIREEIKQAAKDKISTLRFPAGETAMKIEGLGQQSSFRQVTFKNDTFYPGAFIKPEDLSVGMDINDSHGNWVITDVLGDGKFKALPKEIHTDWKNGEGDFEGTTKKEEKDILASRSETFDISGKVDTNNPIYRFYESTVGKYLKNNYGASRVRDPQGVEWFEVPVAKEAASKPVVAYRKFLFSSKLDGVKVPIETAKAEIFKDIPTNRVELVFENDLIDNVATGEYQGALLEGVNEKLKPMIRLYQEGGKVSLTDTYHESGHYIFDNFLTDAEKKLALDMAKKEFGPLQNIKYKAHGYPKDERLEEYLMDEYAKAKEAEFKTGKKYSGKHKTFFQKLDGILKTIVDTIAKVVQKIKDFHKNIPNKQGGFINFNEPLDVNSLKKIAESKITEPIEEILTEKYKNLSQRTIEMFSKRLARLKSTDEIQGLVGVVAKMDQEIKETATVRAYTKVSPLQKGSTAPTTPKKDGEIEIPPSIGELLANKEKSSYIDSLARTLGNPQEAALAHAEYDQIWDKINARAIVDYEQLAIERSILEETVSQNTATKLMKYFSGTSPKEKTLYDLFTEAQGTNRKVKRIDSLLGELGFEDFEAAQRGIESYMDVRDRLKEIKTQMRELRPQVATARLLKDFLDDVPVLQDQPAINAIDEVANHSDITATYKDISGLEKEALDPFRIMRNFFGPRFDVVKKSIIDPFDSAKGDMVDEINRLGSMLEKNVTEKYGIARGSEDAQRIRRYGEGKVSRQDLVNDVGEKRANELIAADSWFRGFFNDLLDEANEVLGKIYPNNPDKLIPKHANYYHHIRDKNALGDALTALKGMFDSPAGISPQLAGKSEMTQPRSKWLSFAQRRLGEATNTDAIEGTIDYISSFAYLKHISPHISKYRYLRRRLADFAPTPGDPTAIGIGKEPGINNFLVFLDNYANRLAGKSHPLDRWISDTIPGGRGMMNAISWVNNRVKANTILGKASSVVAQFANIPAGVASAKQYSIPGMRRTLASIFTENKPVAESDFLKERNLRSLTEQFKVNWYDHPLQRATDEGRNALAWLLRAGDNIGTHFIWNSHYEEALAKGIDDPIRYADNKTRSIVAGRGIGEVPLGQEAKIFQVVAPFQVEVGNLIWIMRDMVRARDLAGIALLLIGNYVYNEVSEKVRGSRVVYDPINALIEGTTMLIDEDDKKRGAFKFAGRQVGELLSNIPLGQTVAGQIPDSTVEQVSGFLTGTPMTKQDIFGQGDPGRFGSGFLAWKALEDPVFRFLLPYGGLQLKTTWDGVQSYINGEVTDKSGQLNFNMDKNFVNLFKATLFGKNAVSSATEYFDEREDLFRILNNQQYKRDAFSADAENKWQELKEIKQEKGGDAAKAELKQLAVSNPKMAEKVLEIADMEAKGFNGVDRLVKQLGVENGERAKFIVEKLNEFDSPTDKKEYLKELAVKELLSANVLEQVTYLMSKQKKK